MATARASAPCRVDLAGGTLDIWPLGLLHPGACTVNLAIDVRVAVEVAERAAGFVVTSGEDRAEAASLADLLASASGRLAAHVIDHVGLGPVEITITSGSPRNAGLGASSALCIALLAACGRLAGRPATSTEDLVHEARDIEARLMSLPTGVQDHYPAVMGGVVEIRHAIGGEEVRPLRVDVDDLGAALTVVYSGRSHFSAGNNFEVVRRRLQDDATTKEAMAAIATVAARMGVALEEGRLDTVGELMKREMTARCGLSDVVSTPEVEDVLARAYASGAWGAKVCGAGGGGCLAILTAVETRTRLAADLESAGYLVLPARPDLRGLETDL
ncbi:MAG: hypothetical protein VYE73_02125 [Acidobacteriota bacterium]|nr:hypothetical protein [Acidobacteriota bacterium]